MIPPQSDHIGHGDLAATAGALGSLFADCTADPACDHDYPNLETQFTATIQRLDQSPVQVSVRDRETGEKQTVWITGQAMVAGIRQALKQPVLAQIMPLTIARLHSGDDAVLGKLYGSLVPGANQAVRNTVLCHDVSALLDPVQFHGELASYPVLKSFYAGDEQPALCQVWEAGQADRAESQPVASDIPTLLLAGNHYDFASALNAQLAGTTLSRRFTVDFPAEGHFVTGNDCAETVTAGFLSDLSRAPDAECAGTTRKLGFVTDVYLNAAAGPLFGATQLALPLWLLTLLGVIGLTFLSTVLVVPITSSRARFHGPSIGLQRAAAAVLWLLAFLALAFGIGAWLLAKKALAGNYGWVTLFGFSPAASELLFIIPWLTAILTLALVGFSVMVWKNRWWNGSARMGFAVVTAAAIGFNGLLIYWQFFAP